MSLPLVVFRGDAGVGKDTLALAVRERVNGECVGFADALKQMAREIFDFTAVQLFGPSQERDRIDPEWTGKTVHRARNHLLDVGAGWSTRLGLQWKDAKPALEDWHHLLVNGADEHGALSPRYVLQTLGTEFGRAVDQGVWVRYALSVSEKLMDGGYIYSRLEGLLPRGEVKPPGAVLIPDGRFNNEVLAVKRAGGIAVLVTRDQKQSTTTTGVSGHASEKSAGALPNHYYDVVIHNNGTLENFCHQGDQIIRDLIKETVVEVTT